MPDMPCYHYVTKEHRTIMNDRELMDWIREKAGDDMAELVDMRLNDTSCYLNDLDSSDLIRRKDVLWITKETGAWETQSRVRELPAVAAVPLEYHDKCLEAAIKKRILTEKTNRQIIENYVPVVHGRWIGESDCYADGELVYDVWNCSKCDYCIDDGTDNPALLPNYCPNCGAKMRSDNDQ